MSDPGTTLGWILAVIGISVFALPAVVAIGFALFELTRPAR
jgi:hypothetical protein